MRAPRAHASKSITKRRVKLVLDALARNYEEESIIAALMQKEAIQRRQAQRYIGKAYQELERLGTGVSAHERGLLIVRSKTLAERAFLEALKEGGEAKPAIEAHKNEVSTIKALDRGKGIKETGHDSATSEKHTEDSGLADVLRLFAQEQSLG